MTELEYHVVDVFTGRAFAGNPLAVVLGADDLTTGQMQAIARELNLSETTFPLPPTAVGADYRLRIFTPGTELPFAGHPSIGSAWLLHSLGRVGAGERRQECGAGVLPITITAEGAELTGAEPSVSDAVDPAPALAAIGLTGADLDPRAPARHCGTGLDFLMLPLASRAAVDRAAPNGSALIDVGQVLLSHWADGVAYARMFASGLGVPEDPATGSAALGYGVWLAASGLVPADGTTPYVIEQGHAMGRPSLLLGEVDCEGGRAKQCRVRGGVVPVANGRIRVP